MQIKLQNRKRTSGAILLGLLFGLGLVLIGCAGKKIWDKLNEIDNKVKQQATNDVVMVPYDVHSAWIVDRNYGSNAPNALAAPLGFQVFTNEALNDESGF